MFLASGCSYTDSETWPHMLFGSSDVLNLGKNGAGNQYIGSSIVYNINPANLPEKVFILWSGLSRYDVPFPTKTIKLTAGSYPNLGVVGRNTYIFSVGNAKRYPVIGRHLNGLTKEQSFLFDSLYFRHDDSHIKELSLQSVSQTLALLDKYNIDYRFSFIYDVFSTRFDSNPSLGSMPDKSVYIDQINWNKFINHPPFEWGIKNDCIDHDGWHLTSDGLNRWANEIKHKW
jgi:hypothetical protein